METVTGHRPYVGFWNRTAAALIDSALLLVVLLPIEQVISGGDSLSLTQSAPGFWDVVTGYVLPALVILVFWKYRAATPGKMYMSAEIVDAVTQGKPSTRQLVLRYAGYYLATIPLLLGLVWVAFDDRKQGWHDKLAGTVVVSTAAASTEGPATAPRYAPTSPWTFLLCAPILALLVVLFFALVAIVFRAGSLGPRLPGLI